MDKKGVILLFVFFLFVGFFLFNTEGIFGKTVGEYQGTARIYPLEFEFADGSSLILGTVTIDSWAI